MPRSIPRPLPQCAYPDCNKTLSTHSATYCREHFKYSPQFLAKVSAAGQGRKQSDATIAKRVEKLRGKKRSPEICDQMSASAKKRANTPEGRKHMPKAAKAQDVNPFKNRTHTEETKEIIREKRAKQIFSEESIRKGAEARKGQPSWNKGGTQSQVTKDKISATLQSKRDHLSQKAKERVARETEEQRERRLTNWIQAGQDNILKMLNGTSIELFVSAYLDKLGIEHKTQERIGYYIVDIYIPSQKLIINVDGCFWHGCEKCGFNSARHIAKRRSDQKRYHYLVGKGYIVKSIWEHNVRLAMQDSSHILQLGLE